MPPRLTLQVWDDDILNPDDLIGESHYIVMCVWKGGGVGAECEMMIGLPLPPKILHCLNLQECYTTSRVYTSISFLSK